MLNVTLDNTCIIDLEVNNQYSEPLRELVNMHNEHQINLRVVAISASELKQNGTHSNKFDEFKERISIIGLGKATILPTLARWDLSFWDYFVFSGRWLDELEKEIQSIIYPGETEYSDFCRIHHKNETSKDAWDDWINHKCDILALWSHIWFNGDIFVSRDKSAYFGDETRKHKLIMLGAGRIWTPCQAVKMLDC